MNASRARLHYFANVRLPSERANAIQIVQMCAAFGGAGLEVRLYHPLRYNRFRTSARTIHEHYGVPKNFETKRIFSLDGIDLFPAALKRPAFRLQSFTFGLRSLYEIRRERADFCYIRDNATLALAASLLPERFQRRLFYEAHDFPEKPASARALV